MNIAACIALTAAVLSGQPPKQVVVTGAAPDAAGEHLTITGENFGFVPFVTLNLVPLTIDAVGGNRIVAVATTKSMPPGTYLLTVSYGPSAEEAGSFRIVLGDQDRTARAASPAVAASSNSAASGEAAAKVGDRIITLADVDREWQRRDPARYVVLSRQLYDNRRRVVDAMVAAELLAREAAARGITTEALLEQEIPKRIITMPESAVISLYQSLADLTRGATLEQMKPALRAWLERISEPEVAKMNYLEELMKVSTRAEVLLAPPRVEVDRTPQDAALGSDSAPVVLVAFGDLVSASYARFAQAFGKLIETFDGRVRLVFKNLPLVGPSSIAAAEAAQCANTQGRFWQYHNAVVLPPGAVDGVRLKQAAADAGLNRAAFEACVERRRYQPVIKDAIDEATRYGITSVPSFLVNGRLVPEPPPFLPPFDFLKRVVEEELSRQTRKP
jgi:protein-disulfide isomerase